MSGTNGGKGSANSTFIAIETFIASFAKVQRERRGKSSLRFVAGTISHDLPSISGGRWEVGFQARDTGTIKKKKKQRS